MFPKRTHAGNISAIDKRSMLSGERRTRELDKINKANSFTDPVERASQSNKFRARAIFTDTRCPIELYIHVYTARKFSGAEGRPYVLHAAR